MTYHTEGHGGKTNKNYLPYTFPVLAATQQTTLKTESTLSFDFFRHYSRQVVDISRVRMNVDESTPTSQL